MPTSRVRRLAATALCAGTLALTGCAVLGPADSGGTGTGGEVALNESIPLLNPGQLTVCSDIPYPPFEFQQDGKTVGYDIDIVQRIADDLGAELSIVDSSFEAIQSGASLTGCDVNISSITITDERRQTMAFSIPYLDDDLVLVAPVGSGITDLESAKGKRIGVQQATTGEFFAEENGLDIVQFEDGGMQVEGLRSGSADAVLGNGSVLLYQLKDDPAYEVVETFETGEQLGMGISPDNALLLSFVNQTLLDMEEDGTLNESRVRWFGEEAAQ
ncbi:MAG: amino acid transporter substrate-binding protein [Citricoccus sp.]|jgi:polar amino acid transport system substrate-binding protein|nr:amino acid transporter substrate-binding protein [Citricoccus sp. WCRC_4]